MKHVLTHKLLC